ncbi:MAG: type II toxin-antitoxin system RelE/ParE family toxin [Verrucomicrobia bacterium]|nr:type II toxin-antitoxin system RelE/ParE family toxin [Verrucomicrobiota bacterium]
MMYTVNVAEKVEKYLNKIPKKDKERILEKIASLAHNPRQEGCKKLEGHQSPPLYRIRSGVYRILYNIKDDSLIVLVVEVGHRKEVYH